MEKMLVASGLAIQLLGAYITYRGFKRGWDEVSGPERFLGPLTRQYRSIERAVRRKLGIRGRPQVIQVGSITDGAGVSERATVLKTLGPLSAKSTEDAIEILRNFVNGAAADIQRTTAQLYEIESDLSHKITERTSNLDARITEAAEQSRAGRVASPDYGLKRQGSLS